MTIEVYGVNTAEQTEAQAFDKFCPEMSTQGNPRGFNYFKASCEYRQTCPWLHATCYPNCHGKITLKQINPQNNAQVALSEGKAWRKMNERGMSYTDIAKKVGYSRTTVQRYIVMAGGKPSKKQRSTYAQLGGEFYRLMQIGQRADDIADEYKISISTVRRNAKDYERGLAA